MERHLAIRGQGGADRALDMRGCVHKKEAAAAGAKKLATEGAGLSRFVVRVIDAVRADAVSDGSLKLPPFMQHGANSVHVSVGEQITRAVGQVTDRHQR